MHLVAALFAWWLISRQVLQVFCLQVLRSMSSMPFSPQTASTTGSGSPGSH